MFTNGDPLEYRIGGGMLALVNGIPSECLGAILYRFPAKGEGSERLIGVLAISCLVKGIPVENLGLILNLLSGNGEEGEYLGAFLVKSLLVKGLPGEKMGAILYDFLGKGEAGERLGAIRKDRLGKGDLKEYRGRTAKGALPKGEPEENRGLMGAPVDVRPKESDKGAEALFFFLNSRKPRGFFLTVFNLFSVSSSNWACATSARENSTMPMANIVKNRCKDQRLTVGAINSTI